MQIVLRAFGNSSDAFGFASRSVECGPDETPLDIVMRIAPGVDRTYLRVALDAEFAEWESPIGDARELAFLPPVSGG